MRPFAWLAVAAALTACARGDDAAADSAAASPPAMAPANLTAADVAGTWSVKGMAESSDSTLITYDLTATNDTTGWSITFPSGQKVPVQRVMFSGDSVVSDVGPYDSQIRKGVRVRGVRSVSRLQDGKMIGRTVARYDTKSADSVLTMRTEGTRKP